MKAILRSPWVRLALVLLCLVVLIWLLVALRSVVTPFAVAFGIAYFLNPPVNALEALFARGLARSPALARALPARTLAVGILCAVVIGVTVIVLLIVLPAAYHQISETGAKVPEYVTTLRTKLEPTIERLSARYPGQAELVKAELEGALRQHGLTILGRVTAFVQGTVANLFGVAMGFFNLLIVPIFAVYLLFDMNRIRDGAAEMVPHRFRPYLYSRAQAVDRLLAAFVRGQITVCLILGTFYAVGLTVCGVPMGLLVGMLIGFFNLIPFMSTVLGLPLAVTLSLIDDQSLGRAVAVAAVFAFGQLVEGNFISPRIVGRGLGLHAVVIMLAVLVGGSTAGFIGMVVAVPVTAALSVFWADLRALYLGGGFYQGGRPAGS